MIERGRAYLDIICAHCHNPNGWDATSDREFDFRYEVPLSQTGILYEEDKIINTILEREMPFIGATMLDHEGIGLLLEFMDAL